jgi:hypothetical protein
VAKNPPYADYIPSLAARIAPLLTVDGLITWSDAVIIPAAEKAKAAILSASGTDRTDRASQLKGG